MVCPGYETNVTFFIFSPAEFLPRLLYYSHIPAILLSLFLGLFVVLKARGSLLAKSFFSIGITFSLWGFLNLFSWVTYESDSVLFAWRFFDLAFILIFLSGFYFFCVFAYGQDISTKLKIVLASLSLPTIFFTLTGKNIEGFDFSACIPEEGELSYIYAYTLSCILTVGILGVAFFSYKKLNKTKQKMLLVLTFGIESFLVPLVALDSYSTYLANAGIDKTYSLETYGLLGMPIFIASVTYLIAKYRMFNIKIDENRAIIIGLLILIGSQLLYVRNSLDRVLTVITFLITVVFGIKLIYSIKKEEKEKREKLEKINRELLKLDETKSEFINIASHQLRTPITVIRGVISMMKSGKINQLTEKEKKMFIDSAWNKGCKLEEIIKDILNAASLTNKKYLLSKEMVEDIDVSQLVSQVADDFKPESERTGISLSFQKDGNKFFMRGIREDLREVFNNLLNNAFKYTIGDKANEREIRLVLTNRGGHILIKIKDDGIGIPEDEISKLFDKFYRATNAKSVYTDGSGLGLFIVREIVEGHHGKVWVESELGQGAEFTVSLPAKIS